ncbi:MAG: hypothetical protein ACR2PG_21785 [Hyphomicrobiaceae bacterium]
MWMVVVTLFTMAASPIGLLTPAPTVMLVKPDDGKLLLSKEQCESWRKVKTPQLKEVSEANLPGYLGLSTRCEPAPGDEA